jgi:hypothetical protein
MGARPGQRRREYQKEMGVATEKSAVSIDFTEAFELPASNRPVNGSNIRVPRLVYNPQFSQ